MVVMSHLPSHKQIRATIRKVRNTEVIIVYQAYNAKIAQAATAANSFTAPLKLGIWSSTRMTWVKPSAIWMGYRCGFGLFKDRNQTNVLALSIPIDKFFQLLSMATLSSHNSGKRTNAKNSNVVVQWDPERYLLPSHNQKQQQQQQELLLLQPDKNCFTKKHEQCDVRSIQIGLRNRAVEMLLDPRVVVHIEDVTENFQNCGHALQKGETLDVALSYLNVNERPLLNVPLNIQELLQMDDNCLITSAAAVSTLKPQHFVLSKELHEKVKQNRPPLYTRNFPKNIVELNLSILKKKNINIPLTRKYSIARKTNGEEKIDEVKNKPSGMTIRTTKICVADIDTVSAAMVLGNNTCILNFANAENPGGYYTSNGRAQEEDLCRVLPQLHPSLVASNFYPLDPRSCLITPDVQICRVPGTYAVIGSKEKTESSIKEPPPPTRTQLTLTVLTAAMPKCNGKRPKGGWLSSASEWAIDVRTRIRCVLEAAASTGFNNIVLGAFGCGAYGNPPREVATIFKQELHSFHFHNVVFAIIDPVGTGNLKQFRKVLCGNGGSRKQAKK